MSEWMNIWTLFTNIYLSTLLCE